MYFIAQHRISEPSKFWELAKSKTANLPSGLKLLKILPNPDGTRAVCLWEGSKIDDVKKFVEGAVGHVSTNEYFQVEAKNAVGLP
jgi:acetoacetate decarboxylase